MKVIAEMSLEDLYLEICKYNTVSYGEAVDQIYECFKLDYISEYEICSLLYSIWKKISPAYYYSFMEGFLLAEKANKDFKKFLLKKYFIKTTSADEKNDSRTTISVNKEILFSIGDDFILSLFGSRIVYFSTGGAKLMTEKYNIPHPKDYSIANKTNNSTTFIKVSSHRRLTATCCDASLT